MRPHRDWALWTAANVLALIVMERRALEEDRQNKLAALHQPCPTLSTTLRHWFGINPRRHRRYVFIPALLAFAIWFIYHIVLDYQIDEIIDAVNDVMQEITEAIDAV